MEQQEVERIARAALKELGVMGAEVTIAAVEGQPDQFRIDLRGPQGPNRLKIRCGKGSTPQWVRTQIFDQFTA